MQRDAIDIVSREGHVKAKVGKKRVRFIVTRLFNAEGALTGGSIEIIRRLLLRADLFVVFAESNRFRRCESGSPRDFPVRALNSRVLSAL